MARFMVMIWYGFLCLVWQTEGVWRFVRIYIGGGGGVAGLDIQCSYVCDALMHRKSNW